MDDDDRWLPHKLEVQLERMASDETLMCCGGGREFDSEDAALGADDAASANTNTGVAASPPPTMPRGAAELPSVLTAAFINDHPTNPIITSSMLAHASVTREAGEFGDKKYAQDYE